VNHGQDVAIDPLYISEDKVIERKEFVQDKGEDFLAFLTESAETCDLTLEKIGTTHLITGNASESDEAIFALFAQRKYRDVVKADITPLNWALPTDWSL
jgi:hypothetical protein